MPEVSALEAPEKGITVDAETRDLLKEIGFGSIALNVSSGHGHKHRAPRPQQNKA